MKRIAILIVFNAFLSLAWCNDTIYTDKVSEIDLKELINQIDTTERIKIFQIIDSITPSGKMISHDSVLVEQIIERSKPLVVAYEKKDWGKLIVGLLSLCFAILAVWNRRKKDKKTDK